MNTVTRKAAATAASATTSVSSRWAAFVQGVRVEALPPHVLELAKVRLLDCLSTSIAARGFKVPTLALGLAQGSTGNATVIGYRETLAPLEAAMVNATLINGRSQDDFLQKSHAGAVTVPAALAMAEQHGGTGADLLAALVAGYEIVGRAYMGGPGMLPRFRATGVAGTIGAAAAAARMLRLDVERTMHALGTAACFAHGFGQGFLAGSTEVKLNVGMASRSGTAAALLARLGATASPLAFEGDAGYYRGFSNSIGDIAAATDGLGERYLIEDTVYKECPVCIFCQTPIALARALAGRVDAARIRRVVLRSPELTHTNPGYTNVAPFRTHLQAAVSARFCVAAALLGRAVETHDCYDELDDPGVLALAEKIDLEMLTDEASALEIELTLDDGRMERESGAEMDTLRPDRDKIVAKFHRLVSGMEGIDATRVLEAVMGLERAPDVKALTALLRPR